MIAPLELSVVVQCDAAHAFAVFTASTSLWWPVSHSVSRQPGLAVTIETRPGGRIFERAPDGIEFDWGEITTWEPPRCLAYLWHIGVDRSLATQVRIEFVPLSANSTRVEITHSGWDGLGDLGPPRREKNQQGWDGLLPHFVAACGRSATQ
jgi:uncharacterized protein YndB with AHSA1/START domain